MFLKNSLILIVALLHFYFMFLEMFMWTKRLGLKTFRMNLGKAEDTKVLAANQGLYNGFLAAGLVWSVFTSNPELAHANAIFFLSCVVIAAIYGAYSVGKRILLVQGLPAVLALACVYFCKA